MFFETTYVPSPTLSASPVDDNIDNLSAEFDQTTTQTDISTSPPSEQTEPVQNLADIEPDSDRPVDHLIFVIHGIGQQTEQYGHFYEHIENLQETTRQVLQVKVPDQNIRIELIPIEWHRHIHDQVDPILNKITLKSIPTIRLIENHYLADVLFYFSKDRGQAIIDNITHLFNTSYESFVEKHPDFNGKIIILGYSLGGIITWDILSHQREEEAETFTAEERANYDKLDIKYPRLKFKPHYFFSLGSPISAVLTFRGQDPKFYHPNFDTLQFENIFHPFDPLGYRFEPLFNDYFIDKPAVLVERSVPIGPSFSFPSMWSSFPLSSAGFFSFFSWKQQSEDKAAKTLYNATSDVVEGMEQQLDETNNSYKEVNNSTSGEEELSRQSSAGFMTSLLQYFTKGGGVRSKKNAHKTTNDMSVSSPIPTVYTRERERSLHSKNSPSDTVEDTDNIPWDSLSREQARQQLLALRDDLDRTLKSISEPSPATSTIASSTSTSSNVSRRPSLNMRSKSSIAATRLYPSSLDPKSEGSMLLSDRFSDGNTSDNNNNLTMEDDNDGSLERTNDGSNLFRDGISDSIKRLPLKKTFTTGFNDHPLKRQQQLVEIIGTDGMKLHLHYDRELVEKDAIKKKSTIPPAATDKAKPDRERGALTVIHAYDQQHELREKGKTTHGEVAVGTNSNQDKDDKDSKSLYDGKSNAADDMTKNRNGSHTDEHSGTGNIWNDLEIEMNKPGPAITNPGESKADVAQDATLPKSNPDTKAKKEQKETDTDEDDIYTASFLPGGCRIDYVLQPESVMSMIANEYLIGLRAHFSYWTNKDFIWHMLRRIDEQLHEIAIEVEAEKKISKKEKQRRTKQKANTAASDTATASASSSSPAMTLVATDEAEDANGFSGNNDSSDVKRTTAVINSSPSIKSINNNSNKSIPKSASNNINSKKKGTDSPSLIINMDDTHLQKRIK